MAIFNNPYQPQQEATEGGISPVGRFLTNLADKTIGAAVRGSREMYYKEQPIDPRRINKIVGERARERLKDIDGLENYFTERSKVAQTGGKVTWHGGISSSLGSATFGTGPVNSYNYKGRDALIQENRERAAKLRQNREANAQKIYGRRVNSTVTEDGYRKRLQGRSVRSWEVKNNIYQNQVRQGQKIKSPKERKKFKNSFVGPTMTNPGKKPSRHTQNRTMAARQRWGQALQDSKNTRGTPYTNAAAAYNHEERWRNKVGKTYAERIKNNARRLEQDYTDPKQFRSDAERSADAAKYKASKSFNSLYKETGNAQALAGHPKLSKPNTVSPDQLKKLSYNYMGAEKKDFFSAAWDGIKGTFQKMWETSSYDSKADQLTATFHGMSYTEGVKGYGGDAINKGLSKLDLESAPEKEVISPERRASQEKIKELRKSVRLGEMAIFKDDPFSNTKYSPIKKPLGDSVSYYSLKRNIVDKAVEGFNNFMADDWSWGSKGSSAKAHIQEAHRNEAAKFVRHRGDNVDPYHDSVGNRQVQRMREAQKSIRARTGGDIKKHYAKQRRNLMKQRSDFYDAYQKVSGPGLDRTPGSHHNTPQWKEFAKREREIDRKQAQAERIANYKNPYDFEHKKTYSPKEGVSGYGLRFSGFMQASRGELAVRGLRFATGTGAGEALMNAFGVMTAKQSHLLTQAKGQGILARLGSNGMMTLGSTYGSLMYTAISGGDVTDFVTNQLSYAAGLQGWRVGSSIGGLASKGAGKLTGGGIANMMKTGVSGMIRGGMGVLGGVTGFAVASLAVQGAYEVAKDMTSNKSAIRKIAKDLSTRTAKIDLQENRQTLTSKQMALSKLAKSGLNDRAMLLGNEARVMKGLM